MTEWTRPRDETFPVFPRGSAESDADCKGETSGRDLFAWFALSYDVFERGGAPR
jgi:hypothetical protein